MRVSEGMRVYTLYMQVDTGRETLYEYTLFVCVCVCMCVCLGVCVCVCLGVCVCV